MDGIRSLHDDCSKLARVSLRKVFKLQTSSSEAHVLYHFSYRRILSNGSTTADWFEL